MLLVNNHFYSLLQIYILIESSIKMFAIVSNEQAKNSAEIDVSLDISSHKH